MTLLSVRPVAAVVACVSLLAITPLSVSAQTFPGRLTIRVYDFTSIDTPVRHSAVDEARAIIADAGVTADWHDCRRGDVCAPEPGDLVVRVVRETAMTTLEWRRPLGFSVVDPVAGAGTLATVFINRIEDSARHAGADLGLLLGRAIAHEVGHLVLRTNEHGDHGLMRAIWTEQEMARNAHDDWVFAVPERRLLRAALQRTGRSAAR
jgi:hypothetical protein